MKLIHTGDLHIGKTMNDFSLIPDQRFILDQLLAAAREEKADAFVIAGDVYDRAVPPGEAVQLLDSFLTSLLEEGIPVLLISGNHDSPERLGFGEEILQKQGLYIAGSFRTPLKKVTLQDAFGPVNFFLFPFVRPAVAGARTADEAVGAVLEEEGKEGRIDPGERNVLISHFFVTFQDKEPELSDAETTIHVGGIDNVDAGHFAPFDYVALGHIHKPQKIGPDNVWYAGAPLAYSFSECAHVKSINVVELGEKGKVTVNQRPLLPLHALRKAEGTLEELLKKGGEEGSRAEDYIQAILTNEEELVDPIGTLRSVYPNICQIILAKREKEARQTVKERHAIRRKSTAELFADFYGLVRGSEMDEARKKVTEETGKKVEQE